MLNLASNKSIGMSACPGLGCAHQCLSNDIQSIAAWGASIVVTLMESDELDHLGVSALPDIVRLQKMKWLHLPIRDFSTPDSSFERDWYASLEMLRAGLENSGHIFIHCRGGLGRTGLVVARLLIEHGWNPAMAIKEIRALRPGAIETTEQERYVSQCRPTLS